MTAVFADTFFFLAAINHHDVRHAEVIDFSSHFDGRIVTSEWVLLETANALSGVDSRRAYVELEELLLNDPRVRIVPATPQSFDRASELYRNCSDKPWTMTDCTSFIIMSDERLMLALTDDIAFEQAGYSAIFNRRP